MEASETRGSQVLRRSNMQAKLKSLVESERRLLVIDVAESSDDVPRARSLEDLVELLEGGGAEPWIIEGAKLTRGQLLEIEVELEAEDVFKVSTILSTMLDFVRGLTDQLRGIDQSELDDADAIVTHRVHAREPCNRFDTPSHGADATCAFGGTWRGHAPGSNDYGSGLELRTGASYVASSQKYRHGDSKRVRLSRRTAA